MKYSIEKETLTAIADKIREKKYQTNQMTPAQMVEELDELGYGMDLDIDESCTSDDWVRPAEYPDPTVIDLTDFDGVYLTYDLRKTPRYGWIGIYCANVEAGTTVYVERGHLSDTEFVVDEAFSGESHSSTNGYYFRQELNEANGNVQLWRVRSEGQIRRIMFVPNTDVNAQNFMNNLQPCVERYGRLPYAVDFSSTINSISSSSCWATSWLERDDVRDVVSATNMNGAYIQARFLKELHLTGWDTSKVTNFVSCFENCWSIKHIPVENITTDSAITLTNMFKNCRCLDNVDIDHFNIDKVTSLSSLFEQCRSLKHLEMSSWKGVGELTSISSIFYCCYTLDDIERNVKNLNVENVTAFQYAFGGCHRLKHLDLSSWNVQKVMNMVQMFVDDHALEVLNLTGWNVSQVTSMNAIFSNCFKLKKIIGIEDWELLSITNVQNMFQSDYFLESFKIKRWDISALASASGMFYSCYSLKEVDLTEWDTPNVLTSVMNMFANCRSLKKLHLPNMDFTASAGVALNGFLSSCYSLEDLDISGWHVAKITAMDSFFQGCRALEEIDLTDWVVDDAEMAARSSMNNLFAGLYNCKSIKVHFPLEIVTSGTVTTFFSYDTPLEYLDIRNFDISKSTNAYTPSIPTLVEYYPPKLYPLNQSYSDARLLTPASLVRILEALPTVTAARTITLGQVNKLKLTDAEIAIATQKGWTVA